MLNLQSSADKLWLGCVLVGMGAFALTWEMASFAKNCVVVLVVSRLYKLDERINKDVEEHFNSIFAIAIPIKKLVCFCIILQKKVCHMLLLNQLYSESFWRFIDLDFWAEQLQFLTILCNAFASHYFIQGFLEGKFWTPFLVPLFCLSWNLSLMTQTNFFWDFMCPALVLVLLFLFCYAIVAHFLNYTYTFQTQIIGDIASHLEQLGSFHVAVQILEIFKTPGKWTLRIIAGPCMTFICVNLSVGACHYPEQFFIRSLASTYSQEDCAICLDPLGANHAKLHHAKITLTGCFHFFHVDCLDSWVLQKKTTCPLCRKSIKDEYEEEIEEEVVTQRVIRVNEQGRLTHQHLVQQQSLPAEQS